MRIAVEEQPASLLRRFRHDTFRAVPPSPLHGYCAWVSGGSEDSTCMSIIKSTRRSN